MLPEAEVEAEGADVRAFFLLGPAEDEATALLRLVAEDDDDDIFLVADMAGLGGRVRKGCWQGRGSAGSEAKGQRKLGKRAARRARPARISASPNRAQMARASRPLTTLPLSSPPSPPSSAPPSAALDTPVHAPGTCSSPPQAYYPALLHVSALSRRLDGDQHDPGRPVTPQVDTHDAAQGPSNQGGKRGRPRAEQERTGKGQGARCVPNFHTERYFASARRTGDSWMEERAGTPSWREVIQQRLRTRPFPADRHLRIDTQQRSRIGIGQGRSHCARSASISAQPTS